MENDKEQSFLGANAGSIIGGLTTIGGWLGIGEGRQDKRQLEQQKKLNDINAATAKGQAEYEQALKLKMWKDTNYSAQLEEAKKAGVSKAAAIGGSGTGTQGASVSAPTGGSAADAASTMNAQTNARSAAMQQGMQLASQLALMKAQKENIEADTANKLNENPVGKEQAGNIAVDTAGKKLKLKLDTETYDEQQKTIQAETSRAISEAQNSTNNARVGLETQDAKIATIKQEAINKLTENEEQKTGIKLDKAKISEIANSIKQRWQSIKVDSYNAKSGRINTKTGGMNAETNAKRQLVDEMLGKWEKELKGRGLDQNGAQNFMRNLIDITKMGL